MKLPARSPYPDLPALYWAHVVQGGPGECWRWTGQEQHMWHGQRYSPWRLAWITHHGEDPPNSSFLRTCRGVGCTNPAHVIRVPREAQRREIHSLRYQARVEAGLCAHGHRLTPENTRPNPSKPSRACLTCYRAEREKGKQAMRYARACARERKARRQAQERTHQPCPNPQT